MSEELLGNSIEKIIDVCNDIYRHIDRNERKSVSDYDCELVKIYNQLIEIKQSGLDTLYPNRPKTELRYLKFRYNANKDEISFDVSETEDNFMGEIYVPQKFGRSDFNG